MHKPIVRLAVRDWDYLTPLALGDVRSDAIDVEVHRVGTLPRNLEAEPYDAGEFSFSRYAQGRAQGEDNLIGVPHFLMRGFRYRCIITSASSPLKRPDQLAGMRIGLTGWQDSGNVWTRAILRRSGIGIDDALWFVGRLTSEHPIVDRLGGFGRPGGVEAVPGERPMVDLLREGALDAVFTPFMPPGFFDSDSGLRFLVPDWREAEISQFHANGYVPGMHLLCVKPSVARANPWLPTALSELLDESAKVWLQKRRKYADTSPWLLDELQRSSKVLPEDWNSNGYERNKKMIDDFCTELHAQQITTQCLTAQELFPASVD